jgi:hypothetical protein
MGAIENNKSNREVSWLKERASGSSDNNCSGDKEEVIISKI